jgi:hypothetical protein
VIWKKTQEWKRNPGVKQRIEKLWNNTGRGKKRMIEEEEYPHRKVKKANSFEQNDQPQQRNHIQVAPSDAEQGCWRNHSKRAVLDIALEARNC